MSIFLNLSSHKTDRLKWGVFLLIFILPGFCKAQTATDAVPVVDHIAICVRNLKKSTAFYTEVLHLQKVPNPFADTLHQWYSLGNHVKLHAIQGNCTYKHDITEHLCFAVGSVKEFAKKLDELHIPYGNWKGDSKEPTLRPDGVLQLYFQDPDGYWIEINSPAKGK
ncbi:VOC family protein [Mucilaginibacter sp. HC2]|uniref:VOC family protein n=1 Tax=Mucilaginibacter inviolabilis TaxID=2714892 RepID=UPI001409349A|nr:VOC family protein [Mucilaginibacter inviolabilis]NHA04051.1 VOC family protein [Mucilaginibacter inviolabilis]